MVIIIITASAAGTLASTLQLFFLEFLSKVLVLDFV